MAINFPISPALDDVYSYLGKSWTWNGFAWDAVDPLTVGFGADGDFIFNTPSDEGFSFITNSTFKQFMIQHVEDAVNYIVLMGSETGDPVQIEARGTDADIGVNIVTKGDGKFTVNGKPVAGGADKAYVFFASGW